VPIFWVGFPGPIAADGFTKPGISAATSKELASMTTHLFGRGRQVGLLAALVAGVFFATMAQADDPKKPEGKKIEDKAKPTAPGAAAVKFGSALGLELDGLRTIGNRIDSARESGNPIALIGIAKELAAAEEVSGKQASIKSADLIKEAVEMAKFRNRPDELKVVAKLVVGEAVSRELLTQAEKTAKAQEARATTKPEERAKGITGYCTVVNNTKYYIRITVNYGYVGTVAPFGEMLIHVGDDAYETTRLYGYAPGTDYTWGPKFVSEPVRNYTWYLNY
jgi:hypothetical protein